MEIFIIVNMFNYYYYIIFWNLVQPAVQVAINDSGYTCDKFMKYVFAGGGLSIYFWSHVGMYVLIFALINQMAEVHLQVTQHDSVAPTDLNTSS